MLSLCCRDSVWKGSNLRHFWGERTNAILKQGQEQAPPEHLISQNEIRHLGDRKHSNFLCSLDARKNFILILLDINDRGQTIRKKTSCSYWGSTPSIPIVPEGYAGDKFPTSFQCTNVYLLLCTESGQSVLHWRYMVQKYTIVRIRYSHVSRRKILF